MDLKKVNDFSYTVGVNYRRLDVCLQDAPTPSGGIECPKPVTIAEAF
jgi:hypothetical protein